MQKFAKLFLVFFFFLLELNAQNQISAKKVLGDISKIGVVSKAWLSAEYSDIFLYPYTILHEDDSKAKKMRIKALYNEESIAFLLSWSDESKNTQEECCPRSRKDGFAVQFPLDYSNGEKLPYISLGNSRRAVLMSVHEASETKDGGDVDNLYSQKLKEYYETFHLNSATDFQRGRDFIFEGEHSFRGVEEKADLSLMDMVYKDGKWRATLVRKLTTKDLDLKSGSFPVSFVIWDGSSENTNAVERLSRWIGVKLLGERGGYELVKILQEDVKGDISNGKKLVVENCAGCHNFRESLKAPVHMAPNLTNISGYSTTSYLRESLIFPSAVVAEGYNPKLQSDFPWYTKEADGNLLSSMPSYEWVDAKSIDDIIAFLSTLKAPSEE